MSRRVLITFMPPEAALTQARQKLDVLEVAALDLLPKDIVAQAQAHTPVALLVNGRQPLGAREFAALPTSVRIIATCSVGYEHIDIDAAEKRGVIITNTPDVLTDCTADFTFMLLLGACRRAREYGDTVRAGWGQHMPFSQNLGHRVSGKTLGILGMGRIGQAVAQRARGFSMQVLYNNRSRLPEEQEQGAIYVPTLHAMLARCDIVSLHAPATASTRAIIDAEALSHMRPGSVLVNTARGALIDETALKHALVHGPLFAAGLDVVCNEPHVDADLAALPNVWIMPHTGSATVETRAAMGLRAVANIVAVLSENPPLDRVSASTTQRS